MQGDVNIMADHIEDPRSPNNFGPQRSLTTEVMLQSRKCIAYVKFGKRSQNSPIRVNKAKVLARASDGGSRGHYYYYYSIIAVAIGNFVPKITF
jgi:hypothetical protein